MLPSEVHSVTTDISIKHKPAFMVNFYITYKCNLDCSYCSSHDNSTDAIPLDQCLKTVDFIFQYTDIILSAKRKHEQRLALNLIGGEPFTHPNAPEILEYIRNTYNEHYATRWNLSLGVTTNGIVGKTQLERCANLVDYWTVSYHTETTQKQKEITLKTIRFLYSKGRNPEVRVMAPPDDEKFNEAMGIHLKLKADGVTALIKPINLAEYNKPVPLSYFKTNWKIKSDDNINDYSTKKGIACCSERPLILNNDRSQPTNFIPTSEFKNWFCAVNWNFLSINHKSEVFHASCQVSMETSKIEPIGTIDESDVILKRLSEQINNKTVPVIRCPRESCTLGCGMCSIKASSKDEFIELLKIRLADTSILRFDENTFTS